MLLSVAVTLVIVPDTSPTTMFDGYGVAGPDEVPGAPAAIVTLVEFGNVNEVVLPS